LVVVVLPSTLQRFKEARESRVEHGWRPRKIDGIVRIVVSQKLGRVLSPTGAALPMRVRRSIWFTSQIEPKDSRRSQMWLFHSWLDDLPFKVNMMIL
jgi:hypothetical protein